MQLGDLLAELRDNILHDVSDQVAGAVNSDYLWSDATLVRYISLAQRGFARKSKCLRDSVTAQCCQFTTVALQQQYKLDPSVIAVLSVQMTGDAYDLARAGHAQLNTYRMPDTYFFDPSSLSNVPPGKPLCYTTDETLVNDSDDDLNAVSLRLFPIPSAAYAPIVGSMRVVRLPLNPLSVANLTARLELPEDYQIDMLDWAAHLATRKLDVDAGMPDRSKEFAATFEAKCLEAKKDLQMKEFTPAQWGFGGNGFTWQNNEG